MGEKFVIKRINRLDNKTKYYKNTLFRVKRNFDIFTENIENAKTYKSESACDNRIKILEKSGLGSLDITFEKEELFVNELNFYLVDELDNEDMCFESITEIKEAAEEVGLKLEDLTIYDTVMKPLSFSAESMIDTEIESGEYSEYFDYKYIDENKIKELQVLLDKWCKDIDTNTYEKSRKLSIQEVNKLLEGERQ